MAWGNIVNPSTTLLRHIMNYELDLQKNHLSGLKSGWQQRIAALYGVTDQFTLGGDLLGIGQDSNSVGLTWRLAWRAGSPPEWFSREGLGATYAWTSAPVDIKFAEAFGATGCMINSPDEMGPVLRKAFEAPGLVLIGMRVDYRDNHMLFENIHEHLLN